VRRLGAHVKAARILIQRLEGNQISSGTLASNRSWLSTSPSEIICNPPAVGVQLRGAAARTCRKAASICDTST